MKEIPLTSDLCDCGKLDCDTIGPTASHRHSQRADNCLFSDPMGDRDPAAMTLAEKALEHCVYDRRAQHGP